MIRKDTLAAIAGVVLVFLAAWIVWKMLPSTQLEQKFDRLIEATGDRNWKRVKALMAEDYKDAWGQNREDATKNGSEALRHFLVLQVTAENVRIEKEGRKALISARLRLDGKGTAIGESVKDYANGLQEDFRFAWERKSWKPWDWKLVSISQPEIDTLQFP